jgi:HemY protein
MRGVIWLVLLFVAAVVAATTLGGNDGLVTFWWGGWRTDVSLNLFVILAVALAIVLVIAVNAIDSMLSLPRRASQWRALRRERAAQAALREALAELLAGRWGRARKAAQRAQAIQADVPQLGGPLGEFNTLARLLEATSLHRLQDRAARDAAMRPLLAGWVQAAGAPVADARRSLPGRAADEAAPLLAAEWALDDRDVAAAQALLATLPAGTARRTLALRLRMQAARQAEQPQQALHLARQLANHGAFSPAAASALLRSLAMQALDRSHDAAQLERQWQQLDAADRRDIAVLVHAASRAVHLGARERAREWLRPAWEGLGELDGAERQQVALALADAAPGIGGDWLASVETAAQAWPQDSAVQLAAGLVLADRQLFGKARRPLEQAAQASELPARMRRQAWRVLAAIAREEGDTERAGRSEHAAAEIE